MDKYDRNEGESEEDAKTREETVAVSKDRITKAPATRYGWTALALRSIQG